MKKMNKKWVIIGLGIAVALLSIKALAQVNHKEILGKWYAEELDQSVIEIVSSSSGIYEGIVRSSSKEDLIGTKMIYDFKYNSENKRYHGIIYSAVRNMELEGEIVLEGDRLKITGKKFFMTKTFYWTKEKGDD